MSKLLAPLVASAMAAACLMPGAAAATLGPHAQECAGGSGRTAMLVRIVGLKSRTGIVRVQSYGGDPATYFEKGAYLERVDVRPTGSGPFDVCMPVPRSGLYAISVRHDVDGSGKANLSDGGGFSGNPNISFFDVAFKRRPSPVQVQVKVEGVVRVPVVLNYVEGASVRPVAGLR